MYRVFITAISMQGNSGLEKGIYQPEGFSLEENVETSFPIIPVIREQMRRKDKVRIIALRTENRDTKDNYDAFLQEVEMLGLGKEQVTAIVIEENQNKVTDITTLMNIIDAIPEDSLIYADITFGTKPMSAMILYAINFIEKLKDAEVDGIYYGELPRTKGKSLWDRAKLYDLIIFKYLQGTIEAMNGLEIADPVMALKKLMGIGEQDEK